MVFLGKMSESRRPSAIPGYSHPEKQTRTSRGGIYKTFTEGKKAKKKEKFGNTEITTQYASSQQLEIEKEEKVLCPVCEEEAVKTCPCAYSDKTCSQGHIWYTARDGKVTKGNPH